MRYIILLLALYYSGLVYPVDLYWEDNATIIEDVYGIEGINKIYTDEGEYTVIEDMYGIDGMNQIREPDGTTTNCYEDVYGIDGITKCY